jgi:hypothetical protein
MCLGDSVQVVSCGICPIHREELMDRRTSKGHGIIRACPRCIELARARVHAELWRNRLHVTGEHSVRLSDRPSAGWFQHWPTF